jgi:hypothetical protein
MTTNLVRGKVDWCLSNDPLSVTRWLRLLKKQLRYPAYNQIHVGIVTKEDDNTNVSPCGCPEGKYRAFSGTQLYK